jgi:hypothetical protein
MADVFTKTTKKGWGSRLGSSLSGMLIGVLLFFASFGVLYWNEGRTDFSKIADDAIPLGSEEVEQNDDLQGSLVSVGGQLTTDEALSDGLFIKPSNFIALERKVEVYAWVEKTSSTSETNLGGSETTETTYTYSKEWVSKPASSGNFAQPEDHENPTKPLEDVSVRSTSATLGAYVVDIENLDLPAYQQLALTESNTQFSEESTAELASGQYIFNGFGNLSTPEVGDVRISFEVLGSGKNVTVFGSLNGNKISTYSDGKDNTMYRAFASDASQAVATLHGEYKTAMLIFRIVGFFMMWIGLGMILGPLSVFLDVVPFLGNISRTVVNIATFLVSVVLSLLTIIVAKILHSVIALVVIIVLAIGFGYWWLSKKKGQPSVTKQESAPDSQ